MDFECTLNAHQGEHINHKHSNRAMTATIRKRFSQLTKSYNPIAKNNQADKQQSNY